MKQFLKRKTFFWVFIITLLFIMLNYNKPFSPIKGMFLNIFQGARSSTYNSSQHINSYFYFIFHYSSIKDYIKNLEQQLAERIVDQSNLKKLESENEVLKQEINYTKNTKYKFITGEVISGFDMSSANILRINIGSKDGVSDGYPVLYKNGIMIGTILKTHEDYSDILLVSDKNSLITVSLEGEERISGILKGNLANALEINYIPLDSKLKKGDLVISSGFEENIPRGLVLGQIKELYFTDGEYFKIATVHSFVDFNYIDFVNVMTSS